MSHPTPHDFYKRGKFTPAPWKVRQEAVGFKKRRAENLAGQPKGERPFFTDPLAFPPLPPQQEGDWILSFKEPPQSYTKWKKEGQISVDNATQEIYLLPIGDFPANVAPDLTALAEFTEAYFGGIKVKVLPTSACTIENNQLRGEAAGKKFVLKVRRRSGGLLQILTSDIEDLLFQVKKSEKRAFCVVAVTMIDLYPQESWNFVFGEADTRRKVGVFSFARYRPDFAEAQASTIPLSKEDYALLFKRSCQVLAHEVGHLFNIAHCLWGLCCLNGANNLEESDAQPIHLCPVDLRKLHASIGFDVVGRYAALAEIYGRHPLAFAHEIEWIRNRLRDLSDPTYDADENGRRQLTAPPENPTPNPSALGAAAAASPAAEVQPPDQNKDESSDEEAEELRSEAYRAEESVRVSLELYGQGKRAVVVLPARDKSTLIAAAKHKLRLKSDPERMVTAVSGVEMTDETLLRLRPGTLIHIHK